MKKTNIKQVVKFIALSPFRAIQDCISGFGILVRLLRWSIVELAKVIYRNPMRAIFVVGITSAFTIMGVSILMGEEFQVLSYGLRVMTMCAIGIGSFIGSISYSQRLINNK